MSQESLRLGQLRGGGKALIVGGLLFVVATILHPSQETPVTILESEATLVASHAVWIVAYVLILLGLAALYGDVGRRMGFSSFIVAFTGTALLAISSQFGFIAPVLAAVAPPTLDAVSVYPPIVVFNGFAAIGFIVGYVMWGMAVGRSMILPRAAGILVALGAPLHLVGFGVAQLGSPSLWFLAILGSLAFGVGLAWCGYHILGGER